MELNYVIAILDRDRRAQMEKLCESLGIRLSLTAVLFGSGIALCSQTFCVFYFRFFEFSGRTKVDEHDITVRFQHDIGRFHITIDNRRSSGMEIAQHIAQLLCPLYHIFLPLSTVSFQCLFQRNSFDIVHDDKKSIIIINNIYDTR